MTQPATIGSVGFIGIGTKQGEPRLLAKLNEWVATNLKNGKLGAIYKKYYGVDLPAAMTK